MNIALVGSTPRREEAVFSQSGNSLRRIHWASFVMEETLLLAKNLFPLNIS